MTAKRKINVLSWEQVFKVREALAKERGLFNDRRYTWEQAAKYLSSELGFPVTPSNVRNLSGQCGINWIRARAKRTTPKRDRLEQRTLLLNALRNSHVELLRELGRPVPDVILADFYCDNKRYCIGFPEPLPASSKPPELFPAHA
jgi:hypothetical protein